MSIGIGHTDRPLQDAEARDVVNKGLAPLNLAGKRLLLIIPDHTRSGPIDLVFKLVYEAVGRQVKLFDTLVALGTHPPMAEDKILERVGLTRDEWKRDYPNARFFNHQWKDPKALTTIGTISEDEIEKISDGLMREAVPVTLNKMILDYDRILIIGPVFPHEVVGFSGGNKYLFPGIAGQEIIDFFHWLGAVITNYSINGTKQTPVRAVVDRAAQFVKTPVHCLCLVVFFDKLHGLYSGAAPDAWSDAADLSNRLHIVYKDRPFHKVLGIAPKMYDDIWTAGKVMYKLEPVIADGGEIIIYAPHIDEVSYTHGHILDHIGYHVRDYFLKQMDCFKGIPRGVMAHSTHVKGLGAFEGGVEKPRVNVVLATRIPEDRCRRINLGYCDPDSIDPQDWANREAEGVLLVPKAGEMLHRLKK